jgi:glycosyltransferase involved in cell wall biosynthesis
MKKLNILIVSEHASNQFGGEAVLPLNYFMMLSQKNINAYLITHERVRGNLESIKSIDQSKVIYIPDTQIHKFLFKIGGYLPDRISLITTGALMHLLTQGYQWFLAKKLVKEKNIDIIHEPSPVSPKQPSLMFSLGVPVIIGPMNGGMSFPAAFESMASKLELYLYGFFRFLSAVLNLLIPGKFFADILLVANKRTAVALPKFHLGKVVELVENGVFSTIDLKNKIPSEYITILFIGRLVDWKAVDILIDAIAKCNIKNIRLHIVGDGPDRSALESLAANKCPDKVIFYGQIPFAEINQYYDKADIFVLPSVRECGGAVVLEAMSRGLPVIATNWGGPTDYITVDTGILIDPLSRDYMVDRFAEHISLLANNIPLREKLGTTAIHHVKNNFLWEDKVDQIIDIYKSLV